METEKLLCSLGINALNAELNPICHLVTLLGAHHILHVRRIRVKTTTQTLYLLRQVCKRQIKTIPSVWFHTGEK